MEKLSRHNNHVEESPEDVRKFLSMNANGPAVEGVNVGGAVNCPGGQATMAQFLQVPATDGFVSVAGFVQSRSHEFGR